MALTPKKIEIAPHSYVQTGKEGSGFYYDVNLTHQAVSQAVLPLVLQAVESITIKSGSVFTIVDYGTADGGMSLPLIYACVKAIREKYGEELPINVIYEDQPVNDFKSLFKRVHGKPQNIHIDEVSSHYRSFSYGDSFRLEGLLPGPPSFVQDFPNVFVMASGTSFYSQCFPNESVTLGISTNAMHWLRDKPCNITNALQANLITLPEEKEMFGEQAEKDWELILLNRSKELMPGGKMIIVVSCTLGHKDPKPHGIVDASRWFWKILKCLSEEGTLTEKELINTNFKIYLRTPEEIRKPFECHNSPVNQAGLELVSMVIRTLPCKFHQKWMQEKGDAKEHAKKFVASVRTLTSSTFFEGLSSSRSAEEKDKIIDEIYQRYEAEVFKHPEDHGINVVRAYLVVQKRL